MYYNDVLKSSIEKCHKDEIINTANNEYCPITVSGKKIDKIPRQNLVQSIQQSISPDVIVELQNSTIAQYQNEYKNIKNLPRDLETFTFLLEAEVNLDSRLSSSSKSESYRVWGMSYLVNTALTLAFPSSSIPMTWYWSLSFLFADFPASLWVFDWSTISFWTFPASSRSLIWDFFMPYTDPWT